MKLKVKNSLGRYILFLYLLIFFEKFKYINYIEMK